MKILNYSYKRRFRYSLPQLIQFDGRNVIVNCTCVNNQIVYIDPASFEIATRIDLNPEDYRIGSVLKKILFTIQSELLQLRDQNIDFQKMFEGFVQSEKEGECICVGDFEDVLQRRFGEKYLMEIDSQDWKQLSEFLDQNNTGFISASEYYFLYDLLSIFQIEIAQQQKGETFYDLADSCLVLLKALSTYLIKMRLSIQDAFNIFDNNNSGKISCSEFSQIIKRVCEQAKPEEIQQLIQFIDKDKNGTVDLQEFSQIFSTIKTNEAQKVYSQLSNLNIIIHKAYQKGIDIEQLLYLQDSDKEGLVKPSAFRSILTQLPIGVLDCHVDEIFDSQVEYNDNGFINYRKILQQPSFQESKFQAELKQSLKQKQKFDQFNEQNANKKDIFLQNQKIIVESLIYLQDQELLIYTTACPKTSTIFITKPIFQQQEVIAKNSKLLAKLVGHKSSCPPTIFFCQSSGCLISGEKFEKQIGFHQTSEETLHQNQNKFSTHYKNISFLKDKPSDILIWYIQRDLFEKFEISPPWTLAPSKVIQGAHYDSIVSLTYMPFSQLIVSSSEDNTIKFWNPAARPHELVNTNTEASIQIKPGYYQLKDQETTQTNLPFCEVRRIYTGETICFALNCFLQKVPVINQKDPTVSGKDFFIIETLFSLELQRLQIVGGVYKSPGFLRGYCLEKLQVEVQANFHDFVIPRNTFQELEKLTMERRKKAFTNYQYYISNQLLKFVSEIRIEEGILKQIQITLRKIILSKFEDSYDLKVLEEDHKALYSFFQELPLRIVRNKSICALLGDKQQTLTINELYYFLKKSYCLHPRSLTRDKFIQQVKTFKRQQTMGVLTVGKQSENEFEKKLSSVLRNNPFDFNEMFLKAQTYKIQTIQGYEKQETVGISVEDLRKLFMKQSILEESMEFDYQEFVQKIDPLFSGKVYSHQLQTYFSSEILQHKLKTYSKPKEAVAKLLQQLSSKERANLIFQMLSGDISYEGYLTEDEFCKCFQKVSKIIEYSLIKEIFESFCQKFYEDDDVKVISIKFLQKLFFNAIENWNLLKISHILGKIKAGFIEKGLKFDYIFCELDPQTKRISVGNPYMCLGFQVFIDRILTLKIPNLRPSEVEQVALFLAIEQNEQRTILLQYFLHQMRKIQTKEVFQLLDNLKQLFSECKQLINQQSAILLKYKNIRKKSMGQPEWRTLLQGVEISKDLLDEVLMRFVADKAVTIDQFFSQIQEFVEEYQGIITKASHQLSSLPQNTAHQESSKKEDFLRELLASKAHEKQVLSVKTNKYTQELINLIRTKYPEKIQTLRESCESRDYSKSGVLDVSIFGNILKFSFQAEEADLVNLFMLEHEKQEGSTEFDYVNFIDRYLTEKDVNAQLTLIEKQEQEEKEAKVNKILKKVAEDFKDSKVNLSYALKFFDQQNQGKIPIQDFKQLLDWMKIRLNNEECEILIEYFLQDSKQKDFINTHDFEQFMYISSRDISVKFDLEIWLVGTQEIKIPSLSKSLQNIEFLRFLLQKRVQSDTKSQKGPQVLEFPLCFGKQFSESLLELKNEFSLKEIQNLTTFAIVGSCYCQEDAQQKLAELLQKPLLSQTNIINFSLFEKSLEPVIEQLKQEKEKFVEQIISDKHGYQADMSVVQKQLAFNIQGILKERDITLWDALISSKLNVTDETKIPIREFKCMINSLNLSLTLKDKLELIRIADPKNTGKCDLELFIKKIEHQEGSSKLSGKAILVILEKFATALFYSGSNINKAFEFFDIDKDQNISKNEFLYGMNQLDLGLSLFEITQIMNLFDGDKNGRIQREEFSDVLNKYFKQFEIDPLQDFSLSLLTKIKSIITYKGADLLENFQSVDTNHQGFVDLNGLKQAFKRFGLPSLKKHQIMTIYQIYKGNTRHNYEAQLLKSSFLKQSNFSQSPQKAQVSFKDQRIRSDENKSALESLQTEKDFAFISNEKFYYKELVQKILEAVEVDARSQLEQANTVVRKVFKLLELKNISLFEAFVHFDVNVQNQISKLELSMGLQNLSAPLAEDEFSKFWKSFEKNGNNKITFYQFIQRFIQAGVVRVIKFDDQLEKLIKKFATLIKKYGDYEKAFKKLNKSQSGVISHHEFKEICQEQCFSFQPDEVDLLFKAFLQADSLNKKNKFELTQQEDFNLKGKNTQITYRLFVRLLSMVQSKALIDLALNKLNQKSKERKYNWKNIFVDFNKSVELSATGANGTSKHKKGKNYEEISLSDLRTLLFQLKMGLTSEEQERVINSFESEYVFWDRFQDILKEASIKVNDDAKEKDLQIHSLSGKICEVLIRERIQIERLFFDFDETEDGTLTLSELTRLIYFLRINANKGSIKLLFEAIDYEKKNYFTLNEFKHFLSESSFIRQTEKQRLLEQQQDSLNNNQIYRAEIVKLEDIKQRIRENLQEHKITLKQAINDQSFDEKKVLNVANLQKVLEGIKVILKSNDLLFLRRKIEQSSEFTSEEVISFQNFLDFAIRENIEIIPYDENLKQIHPQVALGIEKISALLQKLEIDANICFKYFCRELGQTAVAKKDFLKVLQTMRLGFSQDELLLIYRYFDEKCYNEILNDTFVEKFEQIANIQLNQLSSDNQNEIQEQNQLNKNNIQEDFKSLNELKMQKINLRQQVQKILQKIYFSLQEKCYNHKQIRALFDRNGNGVLSNEEFFDVIKCLKLGIPIQKVKILLSYINPDENGVIEVDQIVKAIFDNIPQMMKKVQSQTNVYRIFDQTVVKLGRDTLELLQKIVSQEKIVQNHPDASTLSKRKSGILILEFYKILRNFGVKLQDEQKNELKSQFQLRINKDYYDLEQIYELFDNIFYQKQLDMHQNPSLVFDSEYLQPHNWELRVYRKIGDYLKKNNLTVEMAFNCIDRDQSGLISQQEFKAFILSLKLDLSEKEINQLILSFQPENKLNLEVGLIDLQEFKQKFWLAYTQVGREEQSKAQKDKFDSLQVQKKKLLKFIYSMLKKHGNYRFEKVWALLDIQKRGFFDLLDFKKALIFIGIGLTQEELIFIFKYIDKSKDNLVNIFEFQAFWNSAEDNLLQVSEENFEEGEIEHGSFNKLEVLEQEILEHIAKTINQREVSLFQCVKEVIKNEGFFLTSSDFKAILHQIGIQIETEFQLISLMKIIDPKNSGNLLSFSALEAKLAKYGYFIQEQTQIEKVDWKDKTLLKFTLALNFYLKKNKTIAQFFKEFDEDHDNFLTPRECFMAMNYISQQGIGLTNAQIQRLVHKFRVMNSKQNLVSIDLINNYFSICSVKVSNCLAQNQTIDFIDYEIIDFQVFKKVLENYDGFLKLFNQITIIKNDIISIEKDMSKNFYKKLRGLSLLSKQSVFEQLKSCFQAIFYQINQQKIFQRRLATQHINNYAIIKYLNPDYQNIIIERSKLEDLHNKIQVQNVAQVLDNSIYSLETNSLKYLTPFLKKFEGTQIKTETQIDAFIYPKDTLLKISQDGFSFENHLIFELKVHQLIQEKNDFLFKNFGFYSKKIGIDTTDKEYYVYNENVNLQEYISIKDLISQIGGLMRIPFLTKTNSITYIIRFWGQQILKIIQYIHELGCSLNILRPQNLYVSLDGQKVKLSTLRGISRVNLFGIMQFIPDFEINLVEQQGPLVAKNGETFEHYDHAKYLQNLSFDPYLAPETQLKKTQELTSYLDVWAFGALLFEILFGQPPSSYFKLFYEQLMANNPKSEIKSPSDYFHYELFPQNLIYEILKYDYNDLDIEDTLNTNNPYQIPFIKAIQGKSFKNIFDIIFKEAATNYPLGFEDLGGILDIISSCLEFEPTKRPTIKSLLQSELFSLDRYQLLNSQQFAECVFFYQSPSLNIRDRLIIPLRQLASVALSAPKLILNYHNEIISLIKLVQECCLTKSTYELEKLKANINFKSFSKAKEVTLPQEQWAKMVVFDSQRKKLSNYILVKYAFDNSFLDILNFLVLKHHQQSQLKQKKLLQERNNQNSDKMQEALSNTLDCMNSYKQLLLNIIFQLQSYDTVMAPYVSKIIENLVKFYIGEEFRLHSDFVHVLKHDGTEKAAQFQSFFRRNFDSGTPDEADRLWKKYSAAKPYIFESFNWSPVLYSIAGPLFKDIISEAGVGKCTYPVIQDFIKYSSERQLLNENNLEQKVKKLNEKILHKLPRTSDYYNDMVTLAQNLLLLSESGKTGISNSTIRLVLSYIKTLIRSGNEDKIKLFLDFKTPIYLIPYLNTDNVHIRADLLDIFLEISKGFMEPDYSYMSQLKSCDEINKNLGIVNHINLVNEDKIDRKRFIQNANDYYYLKTVINRVYLEQLALVFQSANLLTNVFSTLKTKAELISNKILMIQIFQNLVQAPKSIIKQLGLSSIDIFSGIFRLIAIPKAASNTETKNYKCLQPSVLEVFSKISIDSRQEIIDLLENTQGIRSILKDQNLSLPSKLSIVRVSQRIEVLKGFYHQQKRETILEVKNMILQKDESTQSQRKVSTQFTLSLLNQIKELVSLTISFLKYYYGQYSDDLIEARFVVEQILSIFYKIVDDLKSYAHLSNPVEQIISQIVNFIEVVVNIDCYFLIFNYQDVEKASNNFLWIINFVKEIQKYHSGIEASQFELDIKENNKKSTIQLIKEDEIRKTQTLNMLLEHESLRKYTDNKLIKVGQSLQRILIKLSDLQEPFLHEIQQKCEFGFFLMNLFKNQYATLMFYIQQKVENLHVISNYIEDTNFRIQLIETILKSKNERLKDILVQLGFVEYICGKCLTNEQALDVNFYRANFKFLAYRNFIPLRNEALAFLTSFIWNKDNSSGFFKELLQQVSHYNLIKREHENLKKLNPKSQVFLGSMYFFTLMYACEDSQILFIMKHDQVQETLRTLFDQYQELLKQFSKLYKAVTQ